MTLVFAKGNVLDKESYGPISALKHERLIYNQVSEFIKPNISNYVVGSRKNLVLNILLKIIET